MFVGTVTARSARKKKLATKTNDDAAQIQRSISNHNDVKIALWRYRSSFA
jgi:hypothetical protein